MAALEVEEIVSNTSEYEITSEDITDKSKHIIINTGSIGVYGYMVITRYGKYKICFTPYINDETKQRFIIFKNERISFVIRKVYKVKKRTHIILYSCKDGEDPKRFEIYASTSNLNFFRLCFQNENKYDKGLNYVSTTFINIELQRFIYGRLEYYEIADVSKIPCPLTSDLDRNLKRRVTEDLPEFISQDPLFLIFNNIFPLVDSVIDPMQILKIKIAEYGKQSKAGKISKLTKSIIHPIFKKLLEIDTPSKTYFLTLVRDILEDTFKTYFIISKDIQILFRFELLFNDIPIIILVIFKIIESKLTEGRRRYKLYYINYVYDKKKYNNIIHIIPFDSVITEYGLDSRYVICGTFINKVFDYQEQVKKTYVEGDGIKALVERNTEYTFIGNLTNYRFLV
jgi:hypothetical protein